MALFFKLILHLQHIDISLKKVQAHIPFFFRSLLLNDTLQSIKATAPASHDMALPALIYEEWHTIMAFLAFVPSLTRPPVGMITFMILNQIISLTSDHSSPVGGVHILVAVDHCRSAGEQALFGPLTDTRIFSITRRKYNRIVHHRCRLSG